ncbi:C2H2 type zinc finger domain-containing protein [Colletotrichum truncatum]|uniref:C2H2 type zinc finger domain-containing protein n=1 Tax=Colletotrichum truncatum TaxID=5467 RepID=A0ACC3Z213_COLTU
MSEAIQSYAVVDKPTASHLPTATSITTANPEDPDIASRPCSPPNVPSKEDAVAFAWNPSSEKISQTQPIFVSHDHDLLRHHNPRFDINESVWTGIQDFLESKGTASDNFILPSLAIANVFLGLFFERFYEQSPVLHIPTLETKQLSPALLSIMIAIGATYSHLRQTRRFSILLFYRSHQNLQDLVSRDRRLTRDPQIIYSYALMCYTGLWCGNKGAFEIAEASRGTLVTYIRRLPEHHIKASDAAINDTRKRWRDWALSESRRRLRWYVFMLDSQFPAILNMRGMMSTSEVHNWQVPCEETFWQAPGASEWGKLLGTESHPPTIKLITLYVKAKSLQAMNMPPNSLKANPWTVFLVISLLASRALDCSQDWATPTARMLVDEYDDADSSNNKESADWFDNVLMFSISNLRQEIRASLEYWGRAVVPVDDECQGDRWGVNQYFSRASGVLVGLVHLHLDISISDLQDALGKSGPHAVEEALSRFRLHLRHPLMTSDYLKPRGESSDRLPQSFTGNNLKVNSVFGRAIADITAITDNLLLQTATPYSILGVFLNCVVLWALVKTSTKEERVLLKTYLDSTEIALSVAGKPELKNTLSFALESSDISLENADAILMHAAQNIAKLGTWGASLNLALLLQLKAFC